MIRKNLMAAALALLPAFALCAQDETVLPEGATGLAETQATQTRNFMAVTANPHATEAAVEVLAKGGSAADAFVAAQAVLGLVEPQSSGLGGGGFLLYYDAATGTVTTLDGRETTPALTPPDIFLQADGTPMNSREAAQGGRSTGVPGTVRLMEEAHDRWGRLAWDGLFAAGVALAEEGFEVSPRMASLVERDAERLGRHPATRAYFFEADGSVIDEGDLLRNPAYAATLRAIGEDPDNFHGGPIAARMVAAVQTDEGDYRGHLQLADLEIYRVIERDAVCGSYRAHLVCGMGPPSSGGLTVLQMLALLEKFDLPALSPLSVEAEHLFLEATKIAYADRAVYIADPDFGPTPGLGLIDPGYIAERAALIDPMQALDSIEAGNPPWEEARALAPDGTEKLPGTTHLSIVDAEGNILAMTGTIMDAFGNRVMVDGFLLNNELTNFSFQPAIDGVPVANRIEPGKRPLSAMAPTLVFDPQGAPMLVLGSPGGPAIIGYVVRMIMGVVDWGLPVEEAVRLPHVVGIGAGPAALERGTPAEQLAEPLQALGHRTMVWNLNSGIHAIHLTEEGYRGGVDPRREGKAGGQ